MRISSSSSSLERSDDIYIGVDDGGDDACVGFTGKVCKDGSCNGYKACENANISSVVNSCVGRSACVKAGYLGGSIGNIVDSCKYEAAC